ncbi:MAG: hypothetical protein M3342_15490 [Bacteroidota bacterium]|nr:hypothetical protein [Bacteroidota bacterium]
MYTYVLLMAAGLISKQQHGKISIELLCLFFKEFYKQSKTPFGHLRHNKAEQMPLSGTMAIYSR